MRKIILTSLHLYIFTFLSTLQGGAGGGLLCAQVSYAPVDSAYLAELEEYMVKAEKQEKAKKLIADYEQTMLRHELSYHPEGWNNIIRGLVLNYKDRDYRKSAPIFPERSHGAVDYGVALLPLASTYVAKLCGVPSRSTTRRMIFANAGALALSVALTQGLKLTTDERRPDGTDTKSMPSGHTSLAFMSATILHREYGYISPWISIGGYTTATVTRYLRLRHHAHWANDLFIGAGIGSISTNFAYYITDCFLGKDGLLTKPKVTMQDIERALRFGDRPTSVSLISGIEYGNVGEGIAAEATYTVGAEMSYFLNRCWAIEAMGRLSTTKINEAQDNLSQYHLGAGVKFSYPILPGFRIGLRTHAGERFAKALQGAECKVQGAECKVQGAGSGIQSLDIDDNVAEVGCGCFIDYMNKENYAIGINLDYQHAFSDFMKNRYLIGMVWKIML